MSEPALTSLDSMFSELDEDIVAVEFPSDSQENETSKENNKIKPKKKIPSDDTSDQLWCEYNRALDLYSDKKFMMNATRVQLDMDIAETIRMIEGIDTRRMVNAILRAFILTYRDRLKKQSSPKPKILL